MDNKNNHKSNSNTVKTLSILLGVAVFIIVVLTGIIVYLLVTKETCDIEICEDGGGNIQVQIPATKEKTITKDQLEAAKQEIIANGNYDVNDNGEPIVYWTKDSTKYHIDKGCGHLNGDEIYSGTIEAAFQQGLTEACRSCIKAIHN